MSDDNPTGGDATGSGRDLDETWRVVRTVGTEEEAQMAIGFLHANDIPAEIESLHVSELPVDLGELSEVRIRVPLERADEAIGLLEAQDEAAPVLDEAEVIDSAPNAANPADND